MGELVLKGVEHVYDADDGYEHPNSISLSVSDLSIAEAVTRGRSLLQEMVDRERAAGGYGSSGMFVAELTRIEDRDGYVRFQNLESSRRGLRYFGGDLEDYRDASARFVFLSYSHRDEAFATKVVRAIERRGLRMWFDRNDLGAEITLLRFGRSSEEDSELSRALERAIDRASMLLLVLSEHSVQSTWVESEVALAIHESRQHRIPITCLILESDILETSPPWVRSAARYFTIHDFSEWQDAASWRRSLRSLLREAFRYKGPRE